MTHQLLPTAAMPCHRCGRWSDGIHVLSETAGGALRVEYLGACCCPQCRPAEPLPERKVGTLEGAQQTLFEGGTDDAT